MQSSARSATSRRLLGGVVLVGVDFVVELEHVVSLVICWEVPVPYVGLVLLRSD